MYVVQHVYISDDVVEKHFVCDLAKCKGACCVEGDFGAPLEDEEKAILEKYLPQIKPYLTPEGIEAIEKQGAFIRDEEGDFSTPTIQNRECAYAIRDTQGILKCGIEQAYREGKIDFPKPISCHLYPIRITKLKHEEALNYERWDVCDAACELGKTLQIPIYQFLKESLIRRYGEAWYAEFEAQVREREG
jgi:hypothetical protein